MYAGYERQRGQHAAHILQIDQPVQRTVRDGLDLLDVEVVVFRHILQLPCRLGLDELRAGNVYQHALLTPG